MKALVLALFAGLALMAPNAQACQSGEVLYVPVQGNGDRQEFVTRTCVNGRFFPKVAQPAPSGKVCVDGTTWVTAEYDYNNDRTVQVIKTCKGGKFASKVAAPKITKCADGQKWITAKFDSNNDRTEQVIKTCMGGKWY